MTHGLRAIWCREFALVTAAAFLIGCSASVAKPGSEKPTLDETSLDGPLVWKDESPVVASGTARRGSFVHELGIPLRNGSDATVTIDRVRLQPHGGAVNVKLAKAVVAGPSRELYDAPPAMLGVRMKPAVGYLVPPQSSLSKGQYEPMLRLTITPGNAPLSYNENVQVYYHDEKGTPWVAVYPLRFVVCVKGETQPSCWKDPPMD